LNFVQKPNDFTVFIKPVTTGFCAKTIVESIPVINAADGSVGNLDLSAAAHVWESNGKLRMV
jgi:hypothetical protein